METLQFASVIVGLIGGAVGVVSFVLELLARRDRLSIVLRAVRPAASPEIAAFEICVANTGPRPVAVTFVAFRRHGPLRRRRLGHYLLRSISNPPAGWPVVIEPGMVADFAVKAGRLTVEGVGPCRPCVRIATGKLFLGAVVEKPAVYFRLGRSASPAEPQSLV